MSESSRPTDRSVAVFNSGLVKFGPARAFQDFSRRADIIEKHGNSLENYKLVVVTMGAFTEETERNVRGIREELIRRHRELHTALKRGSHVCLLLNDIRDYLVQELLSDIKCELIRLSRPTPALRIKRSEFQGFLEKYGTSFDRKSRHRNEYPSYFKIQDTVKTERTKVDR